MNDKREFSPETRRVEDESQHDTLENELVDLGDARAETKKAGGALDMPIASGYS